MVVATPPSASDTTTQQETPGIEIAMKTDSVVCGGGPAGLLTAIMLADKYPDRTVKVYDRLSEPPSPDDETIWGDVAKFYLIGLGSRGQTALDRFGVWDEVKARCTEVLGRMDWAPGAGPDEGVERIFTDRPVSTQVLPRDKLVGVLHQHILSKYADRVELNYGYEVTPVDFGEGDGPVRLRITKCDTDNLGPRQNPTSTGTTTTISTETDDKLCDTDDAFLLETNFLVGADGTARTVAARMEETDKEIRSNKNPISRLFSSRPFQVKRYVDDNQRIYKTIPMKLPSNWRGDLNYSARTGDGRMNFDALPADKNGNYCGVLLLMKDDALAQPNIDPTVMRNAMDDALPQFSALLDDETMASVAEKSPSFLPSFRYAGPRLHQGGRTVILGDCAHTVKPYFGLGANSALEDVQVLSDVLDETSHDTSRAVELFTHKRAGESEALVKLSRELDRPGKLGFLTFILPLIFDSIFHKIAPKVFAPNTIAMLQKKGVDFRGVRRRKRFDRIGQVAILTSILSSMALTARMAVLAIARATGQNSASVVAAMAATGGVGMVLKKRMGFFFQKGLAPADVLAKTKDKVTGSETFLTDKRKK